MNDRLLHTWKSTLVPFAFFTALAGCNRANQYVAPPPPDVTIAQPLVKDVPTYAEFTGNTRPYNAVQIRARVQGYLQDIYFQDEADVVEGQLLFLIDPRPYQAKLDAAKADLAAKKAELVRKNAASPEDEDKQKGDWEVAKAQVQQGEANVRDAQLNLDFTRITAP